MIDGRIYKHFLNQKYQMTIPKPKFVFSLIFIFVFISSLTVQTASTDQGRIEVSCDSTPFRNTEVCPEVYSPVCATYLYPLNCFTTPCPQTIDFPNSCNACKDSFIKGYTSGECVFKCGPTNAARTPDNSPVCGRYREDCAATSCQKTFSSSYYACRTTDIVAFTNGNCPEVFIKSEEETLTGEDSEVSLNEENEETERW